MEIKVICGAVIVKDDKFVIVKEAEGRVRGKWNIPAGHLERNENIYSATKREIKEETGLDVELKGLIGIYQFKSLHGNNVIGSYFETSTSSSSLSHDSSEILDAK